jgi:hypothetical protein
VAEIQARRGDVAAARDTAVRIRSAEWRVDALIRVARALGEHGGPGRVALLREAVAGTVGSPGRVGRLCDVALMLGDGEEDRALLAVLRPELLAAAEVNLVAVDESQFLPVVRVLAAVGDADGLAVAQDIATATRHRVMRATSCAALLLAAAEAGDREGATRLEPLVRQAIGAVDDVGRRAEPLGRLARSLVLTGRPDEARAALIDALNAARLHSRTAFFQALEAGADALAGPEPALVFAAVRQADALWAAP